MLTRYRNTMLSAGLGTGTVALYVRKIERFARTHPNLLAVTTEDLEAYLASYRMLPGLLMFPTTTLATPAAA